MKSDLHILVIGAGSAGKRHARNLRALNCRISACDPRADRLEELASDGPVEGKLTSFQEALSASRYDGFVIASPPSFHVQQAKEILAVQSRRILCEKPLSTTLQEARSLEKIPNEILLGYTYRWWPPIRRFRERLQRGEIGSLRHLRFVMSAHLADWHPWERYQDFFMSRRELGGGALLDESHFIDLMIWFLGMPLQVIARVEKISGLDIDSDDNVDLLAVYPNGVRVNMHLDLVGRPHERSITAMGDEGTLRYSYERNVLELGQGTEANWVPEVFTCERNEMFMKAAEEFVAQIRGESVERTCDIDDGLRTLTVVEACRESTRLGKSIAIA